MYNNHRLGYYIKFFGEAKCHWQVRSELKDAVQILDYAGNQIYLNKKIYIFGYEGAEEVEIAAGTYSYDFNFELSNLSAESVITTHGSIEYHIEAIIEASWQLQEDARVPFKVLRNDSFVDFPEMYSPMQLENEQTFCCCCVDNGSCSMAVSIPRQVFSVGHLIPIEIEYDNQGSVDITHTKIEVKRTITYTSSYPIIETKYETETVAHQNVEGTTKKGIKHIENSLHIPQITATSNKEYCATLKIEHHLHVTGVADSCHSDLVAIFPITIAREKALPQLHSINTQEIATAPTPDNDGVPDYDFRMLKISVDYNLLINFCIAAPSFEEAIKTLKLDEKTLESAPRILNNAIGWSVG